MGCKYITELAMEYFQDCTKIVARRKFNLMLRTNRVLYKELIKEGFHDKLRFFTPRQLDIIYCYLGKP